MTKVTAWELPTSQGKTWQYNPVIAMAIEQLSKENDWKNEAVDDEMCPFEVLLRCSEILRKYESYAGNTNAKRN